MPRPKKSFSSLDYCQYLLSSQINYTLTNYAEHAQTVSHDLVNKYLSSNRLTANIIWKHVKNDIVPSDNGYVVFDDTVLDKSHSRHIDSVRWQYSGNAHDVIRGIGLVNCIYVNPDTNQYWVIDYRVFDPSKDGKSKIIHVQEMLQNIVTHKKLSFKTVLMDTWYATYKLMLFIHHLGKLFYCPIKKNRTARTIEEDAKYTKITEIKFNEADLSQGKLIQLKGMPKEIPMKVFSVSISTNRTDYVVTNDNAQNCSDDTKSICAIRWYVEQFHRELKQLTGVEKCQCRKQRIQRNHIACAMQVWVQLKRVAYQTKRTVYQIKHGVLKDYLTHELKNPTLLFDLS
jgi:hypothetical protein